MPDNTPVILYVVFALCVFNTLAFLTCQFMEYPRWVQPRERFDDIVSLLIYAICAWWLAVAIW